MTGPFLPQRIDSDAPVFVISVAAQLAEMHPQTLRGYDRLGLVVPRRARGRGRRYSLRDIAKLRHIQNLSQNEGINLEGIRRILALEDELESLREQLAHLARDRAAVAGHREHRPAVHGRGERCRPCGAGAGTPVTVGAARQLSESVGA
ncbi:MAG: MerR family transcriptional regulator [Micropruina sp.]|nr:MerR family transcriptional regulator [Micropruina sp.]